MNLDTAEELPEGAAVVTANAYLRARPIADALAAGAQVVVTGRVTDAALVVGPALHAFGWEDDEVDAIAGAVVAGHVIECGAQCCGGNYAFFEEIPGRERIGFPIAEVHPDGSSVVTKHPGTGGAVTVGTVTAQLLYEIGGPRYLSPDAVARFDSIELAQDGPDRVRIGGVRGQLPPSSLKVTANLDWGWRNSMTLALTGAQVAEKASFAADAVWAGVPGGRDAFAETAEQLTGDLEGGGMAYLRLAVRGDDEQAVGRAFSGAVVETSLSSYPGTFFTSAPSGAQAVARYWPTTVAVAAVVPRVRIGGVAVTPSPPPSPEPPPPPGAAWQPPPPPAPEPLPADGDGPDEAGVTVPLHVLVGARSGDKGGDANVGVWADAEDVARWLFHDFTTELFRAVLPEIEDLPVERHPLPNLRAGQLRRPRVPRVGRGFQPPPRHPGQGTGRVAPFARHRGARVPRRLRAAGCPVGRVGRAARRRVAGHRDGVRSGSPPCARPRGGHRAGAGESVERLLRARGTAGHLRTPPADAGPRHRRFGAEGGATAPHVRSA